MSKLEKAIVAILEMFEEYAGTDSDNQLSNEELSARIMCQLRSPEFQSKVDQEDIYEALQKMDKSHNGQVNFKEFSQSVAILAQGFVKYGKGKGKVHQ
ncbi:S100 calcium binding protein W [Ictalurus punctatus]|uniref:S100 calcium binding protein W n=2 Tax=Ictalurus TaxID=7997 RepID=A0A2D0SDR4_ICTPU|nr:S100 calcium binding protein W [Ictalurus punctatus]XP_053479549.1 S100 calcium binding protein W isoform X2 [Ictalurus furcatus]XP_053479556.1 S100 calcium binding protein W isoform X2 [Ictalurus furcatus]